MKRKGTNIITDEDITLTGYGAGTDTVSSALNKVDQRIDKLESNVKWIYKYGGVGSGTGSGGGSSSSTWKVIVTRNDTGAVVTSGETQYFGGKGNYTFSVQIYGGGTSTFAVTYNYVNSKGQQTKSEIVSVTSGFLSRQSLTFDQNGTLSITILNQDTQEPITYSVPYITTSYEFSIGYVYKDATSTYYTPSNNTIFMGDVADRGLLVAFTSNVSVPISYSSYKYQDWEGNSHTVSSEPGGTGKEIEGKKNKTILLDLTELVDIKTYLSNPDNAKYKQFSLTITLIMEGSTEPEVIDVLYLKDNLVPTNMYLKVMTSAGSLYAESQQSYPEDGQFVLGTAVFNLTPYYGALDPQRIYTLIVKMGDSPSSLSKVTTDISQLSDQITHSVSVPITESGEKYIQFMISAESHSYTIGYYFYVKQSVSNFNWYPDFLNTETAGVQSDPNFPNYYKRFAEETKNITLPTTGETSPEKADIISMTINSSKTTYNFHLGQPSSYSEQDQFLCLGVQYSKVNDTSVPIASFNSNGKETGAIFIYQDRVIISTQTGESNPSDGVGVVGTTKEIFFPMVDSLDESSTGYSGFHLISIYKRFEWRSGSNYYKTISIYIDGILEGVVGSLTTVHRFYPSISFYPGNYYCNLIENSCFGHAESASEVSWLEDNDLVNYYYAYREKVFQEDKSAEKTLYSLFNNFTYDRDNFVLTNDTTITNIASNAQVPCIVFNYTDSNGTGINPSYSGYGKDNFKDWMSATYDESYDSESVPVTVQWSNGSGGILSSVKIDGKSEAATFFVEMQGSSTMGYRCKNWELLAPTSSSSTTSYIYSPNFSSSDTSTFLPEESFTLKADVVDSSHSNNNAVASFVNDVTTPFSGARQVTSTYGSYIKNCLTGFPVLVFLHTRYKDNAETTEWRDNYYFLGIYNFNLGRNSAFNLGYKDVSKLDSLYLQNGFKIYEIDDQDNALISGIRVGEVQGNNQHFDFSQFSDSVLYQFDDTDATYMFGDLVDGYSGQQLTDVKIKIRSFVEKVAKAGGYTFKTVGKNFSNTAEDGHYGYDYKYSAVSASTGLPRNMVPNYMWQATRTRVGTENVYTYNQLSSEATEEALTHLILEDTSGEGQWEVGLDYASLCEYYTTCMAFGLVDSVQKNLNIKSWNGGTKFYLAFYDMDTCLGVSNAGSKINYFAFSDYWSSTLGTDGKLSETTVYRDYSPLEEQGSGESTSAYFDVPSSYLFAIAKYAYCILKDERLILHPCNLWAKWRQNTQNPDDPQQGCLKDSETFMSSYYSHHLDKVPRSAFNHNYRYKYLVYDTNKTSYDLVNYPKFYGRKVAYTEDWLEGRFHILDAYFNLNSISDVFSGTESLVAPIADASYVSAANKDIYVLNDIFSTSTNGNQYSEMSQQIQVKARPYAPFIIKGANESHRYIFPETSQTVKITITSNGVQNQLYGGSSLWTELNTINPFITKAKSLTLNSDYFTSLIGNSGYCTSWNINTPSAKTISLTSANYSGDLAFESTGTTQNFPNLKEITVSGSGISLSVNNAKPNKIAAIGMKSGSSLNIQNVSTLTDVSISGNMSSLNITAWKNGITLPTTYSSTSTSEYLNCSRITITNNTSKYPNNTLLVINNETLTTLDFSGFTKVVVKNCPRLTTINIQDVAGNHVLTTLNVVMPSSSSVSNPPTTFTIGSTTGVADLSNETNLTDIVLQRCLMTTLVLPNKTINLGANAFYHCDNLTYLNGNGNYYITSSGTFQDCPAFTLLKSDNSTRCNLFVPSTTTTLRQTFYISDTNKKGSINLSAAKKFLEGGCINATGVTDICRLFQNQNIAYSKSDFMDDYLSSTCNLKLSCFPKASDVSYCLWDNPIDAYNRYMFTGLGSSTTNLNFSHVIGERVVNNQYVSGGTNRAWEDYSDNSHCHVVYTTIDFLYEVIDRIGTLSLAINGSGSSNDSIYLYFMKVESGVMKKIETTSSSGISMMEVFNPIDESSGTTKHPKKLTSLSGIEIYPDDWLDFSGMFGSSWDSAVNNGISISTILYYNTYKFIIPGSLDSLLKPIKLLSISTFLPNIPSYTDTTKDDRVDMREFINWDDINNVTNLFFNSNNYSSIGFKKYVTYDDFQYIWNKIINSSKLTSIGYLFKDCLITDVDVLDPGSSDDHSTKFELLSATDEPSANINTKITQLGYLFMNCRTITDNISSVTTNYTYWDIDYNFFKHLPGITWCGNLFYNTLWEHCIPFNFFRKRKESNTTYKVYVNYLTNPEASESKWVYVAKPGIVHNFTYTRDMTYMGGAFANIKLRGEQSKGTGHTLDTDRTFGFSQSSEYNGDGSIITRANIRRLEDGVEVEDEDYTEYYTKVTDETPAKVIDSSKVLLTQPTEIQDIDYQANAQNNGLIDYTYNVLLNYGTSTVNAYNYNLTGYQGLILPPDILYGMSSSSNNGVASVFYSGGVSDSSRVFTGILPPNLLKNCKTSIIRNSFGGLQVMPVRIYQNTETEGEVEITNQHFLFVPQNFTECEALDSSFNFRFLIPGSSSSIKKYYYVLLSDSISNNTSTLSNSLPSPGSTPQYYIFGLGANYYEYWKTDSGVRYIPIATWTSDNEFDTGLDMDRFSKLKLDNYLNNYTAAIMYGKLFRNSFPWSISYLQSSSTYFINAGYTIYGGLSFNIAESDWPVNNNRFIQNNGGTCYVQKTIISNFSSLDTSKYPNITFYSTT